MSGLPVSPIVVADSGGAFRQLREVLGEAFKLAPAETLAQAKALLKAETPLVICGCHFDDGRLYELLRYMKARQNLSTIPFLTIRTLEGELEEAMYESVKIATAALGGNGFIDLFRWQRLYGREGAARQFAERVAALALGAPGEPAPG